MGLQGKHILKQYTQTELQVFVRHREGEKKIGENVSVLRGDWREELSKNNSRYVILGIPEDIGVRANQGRAGAHSAWKPALDSFLNQQANYFLDGTDILVLGEVEVEDLMLKAEGKNSKDKQELAELRELVKVLDERVTEIISAIVACHKIPLIIGGGHNNAFGNIKGSASALGGPINSINCDPHFDFRALEGRHSGNGFSYAFEAGYLNKYAVLCMHEQYNNKTSIEKFRELPQRLFYTTYEDVFVRETYSFQNAVERCLSFLGKGPCGLEIDLDAITNVPSSAKTSSGLSPLEARQFVYQCASKHKMLYFHIAEAAPILSHIKADNKTGKLIAYLISDFIKGNSALAE